MGSGRLAYLGLSHLEDKPAELRAALRQSVAEDKKRHEEAILQAQKEDQLLERKLRKILTVVLFPVLILERMAILIGKALKTARESRKTASRTATPQT